MALTLHKTLYSWFRPTFIAIFGRNLSWEIRWRLLLLQPISILSNCLTATPWMFSRAYTVTWLPIAPNLTLRAIVFKSKKNIKKDGELRPLHLDIHGGAWLGGLPEYDATFCNLIAEETGAVVISTSYRYTPEYTFPTATDDIDAVVKYLHEHAAQKFGADPKLMTISGGSAGGNMAFAATQQEACHEPAQTAFKAVVANAAVMDLRLKPEEKPKPFGFPEKDPLFFLMPLFDAYASAARAKNMDNPRFSPILISADTLPKDILMIIPGMDILQHEQLTFAQRIMEEARPGQSIEPRIYEGQIHGWTELPSAIVGPTKMEAINGAVAFLKDVYRKYGWVWDN